MKLVSNFLRYIINDIKYGEDSPYRPWYFKTFFLVIWAILIGILIGFIGDLIETIYKIIQLKMKGWI